jgi:hypothetical protein
MDTALTNIQMEQEKIISCLSVKLFMESGCGKRFLLTKPRSQSIYGDICCNFVMGDQEVEPRLAPIALCMGGCIGAPLYGG